VGVTCKSCKFFIMNDNALIGECFLYPKVYQVQPGHWCGQYKRRPKEVKEEKEKEETMAKGSIDKVIQYYCAKYKDKLGATYTIDWHRDTAAVKKMFKEDGMDKMLEYIDGFIDNTPRWYKEKNMINLFNIPKARNQIKLKAAKVQTVEHDVAISAQAEDHGDDSRWPDYTDYRRKGGLLSFKQWRSK